MGFIEILDTEGNTHLINPNEIVTVSDIREYRIIYVTNKELQAIVTDLALLTIKARIKYAQQFRHKINLNGGMLPSMDNN